MLTGDWGSCRIAAARRGEIAAQFLALGCVGAGAEVFPDYRDVLRAMLHPLVGLDPAVRGEASLRVHACLSLIAKIAVTLILPLIFLIHALALALLGLIFVGLALLLSLIERGILFVHSGRAKCPHPGRYKPVALPIYGGPSAGKTMFKHAGVVRLLEGHQPDLVAELIVDIERRDYQTRLTPAFDRGRLPPKTAVVKPSAYLILLRRSGGLGRAGRPVSVYLYDPTGETNEPKRVLEPLLWLLASRGALRRPVLMRWVMTTAEVATFT